MWELGRDEQLLLLKKAPAPLFSNNGSLHSKLIPRKKKLSLLQQGGLKQDILKYFSHFPKEF